MPITKFELWQFTGSARPLELAIYALHFLQLLEQLELISTDLSIPFGKALLSKAILLCTFACAWNIGLRVAQLPVILTTFIASVSHVVIGSDSLLFSFYDRRSPAGDGAHSYDVVNLLIRKLMFCLSAFSLTLSLLHCWSYGLGNLYQKFSGTFKVGHKLIYTSKTKQAVSVFYPMDSQVYEETVTVDALKKWLDYKDNDAFLEQGSQALKWIMNRKAAVPSYIFAFQKAVTT